MEESDALELLKPIMKTSPLELTAKSFISLSLDKVEAGEVLAWKTSDDANSEEVSQAFFAFIFIHFMCWWWHESSKWNE